MPHFGAADAFCESDSDDSSVTMSVVSSVFEDDNVLLDSSGGSRVWDTMSESPKQSGGHPNIVFCGKPVGEMDAFMRSLAKTDRNLLQYRKNLTFLGDTPKEILTAYDSEEAFERVIERYVEKGKLVEMKPSHMTIIWKKLSEWNIEASETFSPPAMFLPSGDLTGVTQTTVAEEEKRFKRRSPPGFDDPPAQPLFSSWNTGTFACAPKPDAWNSETNMQFPPQPKLETCETAKISSYKSAVVDPAKVQSAPNSVCLTKKGAQTPPVQVETADKWTVVTRKERKPTRKPRRRCDEFFEYGTCKHGDSCKHGHHEDEIDECTYGTLCNHKDTTCRFKHTQLPYCKYLQAGEKCPHYVCKYRGHE